MLTKLKPNSIHCFLHKALPLCKCDYSYKTWTGDKSHFVPHSADDFKTDWSREA